MASTQMPVRELITALEKVYGEARHLAISSELEENQGLPSRNSQRVDRTVKKSANKLAKLLTTLKGSMQPHASLAHVEEADKLCRGFYENSLLTKHFAPVALACMGFNAAFNRFLGYRDEGAISMEAMILELEPLKDAAHKYVEFSETQKNQDSHRDASEGCRYLEASFNQLKAVEGHASVHLAQQLGIFFQFFYMESEGSKLHEGFLSAAIEFNALLGFQESYREAEVELVSDQRREKLVKEEEQRQRLHMDTMRRASMAELGRRVGRVHYRMRRAAGF